MPSLPKKPNTKTIGAVAEIAQLQLTEEQIAKLAHGEKVAIDPQTSVCKDAKCAGIKIADLGNGCGLYLSWQNGGPFTHVCCQW